MGNVSEGTIILTIVLVLAVVVFFVGGLIYAEHVKRKRDRENAEWGITDVHDSETNPSITKMGLYSAYGGGFMRGIGGMSRR